MDLLKLAVVGGIGWYVYTRYLVKKSIGTGVIATPKTIAVGEPTGYAVDTPPSIDPEPMYRPVQVPQMDYAPWYDKAKNIIM
ncbi:hypothetical protein ACO0LG_09930 [Undibacterium sp. Ji42W]|uniref:hypothetical protein n=1 Tax=Undibacterium sp. Ji42W TaxID=3413039 RepID=UPI003BF43C7D